MKILIVSENPADSHILRKVVRAHVTNAIIVTAVNKAQAIEIVCNDGPFAFYIMDCDIKNFSLTDIVTSFVELSGVKPILFTGLETNFNSHVTQEVFENHEHNQFLPKPYSASDFDKVFKEKLDDILKGVEKLNVDQSIELIDPADFIKMRLRGFYLFEKFPYDIYLEITPTRYLKLLPANTVYSHSFLASYAKKNVKHLHIKKDDQLRYLEDEMNRFIKTFEDKKEFDEAPFTLLLRSITVLHQYLQTIGISSKAIQLMQQIIETISLVQKKTPNLLEALEEYPFYHEGISSKSLLTALISVYFARNLEWDSQTTKGKLISAAILQDYALSDEMLSKVTHLKDPYLKKIEPEALEEFKAHPIKAARMAGQFTKYSDIDSIVMNQHELPSRKGFPNKISNGMFSRLNYVFNMSQFLASRVDGLKFQEADRDKILLSMKKDFNLGGAKEVFEILRKTVL